ncbi:MAG: lipocalin-like domain-containing protein [Terracidiphilus sp.]
MKALFVTLLATVISVGALAQGQAAGGPASGRGSDRDSLIGAWHLVSMQEPGADGKLRTVTDRKGALIYTRDGHMSVQIMYPASESAVTNDYVRNGYEASFGSYEVNEAAHTVTHDVEGSITSGLVGKHLTRVYRISGRRLMIHSVHPEEHWEVTWEHD